MNHPERHATASLKQLVPFNLDEWRCALDLWAVHRIIRVVEVTPLPNSPEIVLGVVNVQGEIIPVVNMRRRFGLPEGEAKLCEQMIIARTAKRAVALLVDSVGGVVERPTREVTEAGKIVPGTQYLEGVAKTDEGILLIHDLNTFLSLEEETQLNGALAETSVARK
ncbi:MAG TPA: chemotaxis protein CheW [Terriglobia bacterium]|nr:chemotaxis protein CheW [Terriglobia bacterium]